MLYPKQNICHDVTLIDGLWDFFADKENKYEENELLDNFPQKRMIAVPASWNEQYEDLFKFFGKGWYEKTVFIPLSWKNKDIYLRFGSVSGIAKVWVNGKKAMQHVGTALPFEENIAPFVNVGEKNKIVVLCDNTLDPWGLPPAVLSDNEGRMGFTTSFPAVTYDFFPYGGIARSVMLYSSNKIRISDITIKTDINGSDGIVNFSISMNKPIKGTVKVSTDNISEDYAIDGTEITGSIIIKDAKFWDIGQPNLYTLDVKVYIEDKIVDSYEQSYGIRTVKVIGEGLYLNGKKIFLKGFGKHEDFYIIGKGFNHSVSVKDFGLLKWIGANSFRTSHYPYDENILDMADKNGILVIGETPFVGLNHRNFRDDILERAVEVIKEMITRDKNHPSVIMWSLANEPKPDCDEADHFFKTMAMTARALDDTRPITYVAFISPDQNEVLKYFDVVCINKYFGWYEYPGQADETLDEFSKCLDSFHDKFKKGIILTEFGADAIQGMHTNPPQMFTEEYQAEMIEKQYNVLKSKPYAIGAHVWAFADFKTAQTISRIIFNRKGVFTRERDPKLAAHVLKRMWNDNCANTD